jgi:hypothetical protein
MIFDAASVHRRYTGEDGPAQAPAAQQSDAPPQTPRADKTSHAESVGPPATARPAPPAVKKATGSVGGKSASYWDDGAGELKQTVSNADFSIPSGPQPLLADDARAIGAEAASSPVTGQPASEGSAQVSSRSDSHVVWFVIGVVAGLAATAVLCRRWRNNCKAQLS